MLYFKFHALKQDKEMKYTNVIKKKESYYSSKMTFCM